MEEHLCKSLLPLVNDPNLYPKLQEYVSARIAVLIKFLENTKDHTTILEIQGSIAELRRFQTLQEQVKTTLKEMH